MELKEKLIEKTIESYEKIANKYFEEHNDISKVQNNLDKFARLIHGRKILDVGCGPGRDARYLSMKDIEIIGIDITEKFIDIASKNAPKAKFILMNMKKLCFPDKNFDGIWCWASFLHIPKEKARETILEFNRVLKENGVLALSVKKGKGEEFVQKDKLDKRFYSFYEEDEIKNILVSCGFEIINCFIEEKKSTWINVFARKGGTHSKR